MRTKVSGSILGLLGALIGLVLTFFGWFMLVALGNSMPTPILTTFYWIGLILAWTLALLVTPFLMITKGTGSFGNAVKGLVAFFVGVLVSMVTYYFIPPILDALTSDLPANIETLSWAGLALMWLFLIIIYPAYKITSGYMKNAE